MDSLSCDNSSEPCSGTMDSLSYDNLSAVLRNCGSPVPATTTVPCSGTMDPLFCGTNVSKIPYSPAVNLFSR